MSDIIADLQQQAAQRVQRATLPLVKRIAALEAERDNLKGRWDDERRACKAAEAEVERLRCCGNCVHIEVERIRGKGWDAIDDFRLECDCNFFHTEWAEWQGSEFSVVGFGDRCHYLASRWAAREEGK